MFEHQISQLNALLFVTLLVMLALHPLPAISFGGLATERLPTLKEYIFEMGVDLADMDPP
jgi:hypothetical protein